ncbi:START domain-containing protein [Cocleimonas sp. KMM 6892]|uniref:START domain-containing protein n=1 Tax=unclassified Cocleimonas TaxID=2639732 RepID=UPI002DB5F2EE|nr:MULTISPECIES: START domain-containing protein [unclassified Cocleimonas]MEB8432074.1 START domain-containing protein [Cocleimonas sp. KMM 6892]MEC4714840.1 START domain-containing protein [Cocleimonas sp. KMM 6895]MEC4744346.1 START domain-containing protein [Cocleimonas sp. KMM 6896]
MFISTPIFGVENPWLLEKEEDNIDVYIAKVKGSAIKTFRGVVTVDSSLHSILSVIADASSYPRWLYHCKSAKMVQFVSYNEVVSHVVTDMPWPFVDRDSIIQSIKTQNPSTKTVTIRVSEKPGMIGKISNTIRVTNINGLWVLTPLHNGRLNILFQMSVDPGGSIPNWLVNSMLVDIPFYTLQNLRRVAKESQYQ